MMIDSLMIVRPNVEVSGLRGFSRRSARLPGWASGTEYPLLPIARQDFAPPFRWDNLRIQRSVVTVSAEPSRLSAALDDQFLIFETVEQGEHFLVTIAKLRAAFLGGRRFEIRKPITLGFDGRILVSPLNNLAEYPLLHRTENWNSAL
ncbi:hypothetical protein B9N43_01110 [Denitratisoma sp. DHT3]|nr:hypothetical protein B9N43_01110 [Denitratisoma sp. DHT3]